ncbi:unnamed protein product [Ceutorhynchus assimilis]|uniref:THAP-type domain-containing protein n=1 Tax=Ceutorhynchus assimilis TaxID=467358 RepID=A0A9N9MPP6_9CUCU|nr:unnamed protein product [Ceutorhynchus assimilis]
MVASCVAYGCKNLHRAKEPLTFHSFPFKRPEILELWVKAIKRENWRPTKSSRICGAHFLKTDFFCLPNTKRILLNLDAVPSVFDVSASQARKCKKHARDSGHSEESIENIDDNEKPEEERGQDIISINQINEAVANQLGRHDDIEIEHDNEISNGMEMEVIQECNCDNKGPESSPKTQTDSGTEEQMDENWIFEIPSTSTNKLSINALKTFAEVAVQTKENGNGTVEKLRKQIKQLRQIIRRKDVKIACLEEVIKELCETAYEKI